MAADVYGDMVADQEGDMADKATGETLVGDDVMLMGQ